MAKPVENKEEKVPNGNKMEPSMVILISNAVIVIVVIVSMIVMYISLDSSFNRKIAKLMPDTEQSGDEEGDEEREEGVLLDLGEFILNLSDASSRRYLKVGVALELSKTEAEIAATSAPVKASGHGEAAADPSALILSEMERYKPAVRDAVISVLSNKSSDELSTPTGKELAKEEIQELVNGIFEGQREVMRVSFGQFIIQ